ncbi:MAG TPA: hypothetical protein VFM28_01370 [Nitrososphaeraceae archaeon]|nr:hypothetical protein [Nitrososphaeraceae archaeon]
MNKIVSIKRISAVFLAIVLVAGTISALSSPSFMVGTVQAQPYYDEMDNDYNSYEQDYGMGNNYNSYEQDYGKDVYKKPQIFPANKVAEFGDRWWQWGFGLDTTVVNPFTELGQAGCDVGLQDNGRLLFLVGSPRDPATGDFPVHECDVKKGTSILFPILNVACNNLEAPPFFGANEQDQRICANNFINATIFESLQLEIDGKPINNLEQYRVDSPAGGFEFTAVENNPFATPVGDGTGVSDGFWILLENLKPGEHTISFSGAIDLNEIPPLTDIFEAGATYNLFVEPRNY